jgi:hypothetical protein
MADTQVTVPDEVTLTKAEIQNPRFTPRELRLIREYTGKSLTDLLGDEHGDDKFTVFGWLKLRRLGVELAWEEMDDVVLSFDMNDPVPDPTNGRPATTSPSSAATST